MNIEIGYGGITNHYISPKGNYCNKLNSSGTIYNKYGMLLIGDKDVKIGVIKGQDSVCGNINGIVSKFKISDNFDFVLGGYNTNIKKFNDRGLVPPTIGEITPVIGINAKIDLNYGFFINNVISYGITTHFISYEF